MLDYVRKNIIKQITRVISAIKKEDFLTLKELSNRTVHSASVYQDKSSLVFALTIYSLSKIVERCKNSKNFSVFENNMIKLLEESKYQLTMNNIDKYKIKRKQILKSISSMDKRFKFYIEEVIDKAKIKKGSKLYEHGVSTRRAAELLGVSQWELMTYVGKTKERNFRVPAVNIKDRLAFARKIFNL